MTRFGFLFLTLAICQAACAQSGEIRYKVGNTRFAEDKHRLTIHSVPPTLIDMQPGGKLWPPVSLDEAGLIYAGSTVVDADSGREVSRLERPPDAGLVRYPHAVQVEVKGDGYLFSKNHQQCFFSAKKLGLGQAKTALSFLKDGNLRVATSEHAVQALVTQFSREGMVSGYQVDSIDLGTCKVASVKKLGKPDLFVELASSACGGWWITGSIEQTLLRSRDGRTWAKVPLPRDLSSLISSFMVSSREIWLAAMLATDTEQHPYMLVYSANGGQTWISLKKDDPLLKKVPLAWLEGQKRVGAQDGQ